MTVGQPSPSRRRFLQSSTAAGAAVLSAPLLLAADEAPKKPKADEATLDPAINKQAAATTANSKLNVALIGSGGQGRSDMMQLLNNAKQNIVAICDCDEKQLAAGIKDGGEKTAAAKTYNDYRKLLEDAKTFDAVIIGTPDHWHAPLATAFIKAGKHVFCEKPLTRTLGEARALRELVRANPKIVTQLGNQGSAEQSLRRSVEVIRAGGIGQVHEVHSWLSDAGRGEDRPTGDDPVPVGFNWDYWCGPSPFRPFRGGFYHPFAWRGWFDFGGGPLADFTCHIYNTALRGLDLTYANKVEVEGEGLGKESFAKKAHIQMKFPGRKQSDADRQLDPVTLHWYNGGPRPSDEILKDVLAIYPKVTNGCLIVGDKGIIWCNPWNNGALIKLNDEPKLHDINRHEATKDIAISIPRSPGHMQEFVNACKGEGKTYSDFDFGGHLTEIGLTGVLAVRVGHDLDWNGETQVAANAPESAAMIKPTYRRSYMV